MQPNKGNLKLKESPAMKTSQRIQVFRINDTTIEVKGLQGEPLTPISEFKDLPLAQPLLANIEMSNYLTPTVVQKYSIPIISRGYDLMSCAQTGSGKTAAFLLPIINQLAKSPVYRASRHQARPCALILAPTRELALQIYEEACKFSFNCHLRLCVVYGGESIHAQINDLNNADCHILVATPGRLKDLHRRGKVSFARLKFLVLDEADRMLDMGFEPQIRELLCSGDMPASSLRQTLMFSATFPVRIRALAGEFLREYVSLSVGRVGSASGTIRQRVEWVSESEKPMYLIDVLSIVPEELKLVFVETKKRAGLLEALLREKGFGAVGIHGDKSQWERGQALRAFREGSCPVLVATSVVARGLDVSNIGFVVNYDLPVDLDDYVHRIGRTGRAGNVGEAVSFFSEKDFRLGPGLCELFKETGQEIPEFLKKYGITGTKRNSVINRKSTTERVAPDQESIFEERREVGGALINRNKCTSVEVDWFETTN